MREDSFSNNDLELDDFEYKTNVESPSHICNDDDDDDNGGDELVDLEPDSYSTSEYEISDKRSLKTYLSLYITDSVKLSSDVRLDLINEINDEFVDDDIAELGKPMLAQASLDDDEDERRMSLTEAGESLDANPDDCDDDDGIHLSSLRVAIDGLEELIDSADSRYVFVIRVWNVSTASQPNTWLVKRRYDEFYVLDTRLRQFHGGGLLASTTSANRSYLVSQLPPKPRAILSFSNKENNLQYLESLQNDFERYLQVQ